jgi:hypothetical protein
LIFFSLLKANLHISYIVILIRSEFMYYNYYRDFEENEDLSEFSSPEELYELETFDLPQGCPYRMFPPSGPIPPPFSGGSQQSHNAPSGPPPNFTPSKNQFGAAGGMGTKAVDPGAIRPCTFRFVYIWLRNGRGFWAFLTFVGRRSASGFRWNGRRWIYFGIDLNRIDSFYCY